jgi:hypothetical protein
MGLVLGQDRPQMPLAKDQHPVSGLHPGREHEPFRIGVSHADSGAVFSRPRYLVGAENSCDQAILVDDATDAVMPPDPEMIQLGDPTWQWPQRRGMVQGAVRPVGVCPGLLAAAIIGARRQAT